MWELSVLRAALAYPERLVARQGAFEVEQGGREARAVLDCSHGVVTLAEAALVARFDVVAFDVDLSASDFRVLVHVGKTTEFCSRVGLCVGDDYQRAATFKEFEDAKVFEVSPIGDIYERKF